MSKTSSRYDKTWFKIYIFLTYIYTKTNEIYKISLRKECAQINGSMLCSMTNSSYFQEATKILALVLLRRINIRIIYPNILIFLLQSLSFAINLR